LEAELIRREDFMDKILKSWARWHKRHDNAASWYAQGFSLDVFPGFTGDLGCALDVFRAHICPR
jgi:hypothetical protein